MGGVQDHPAVEGILVVDKPGGWTSHDVVARIRKLAGTRRVGHAGTLDPMATGVLVVGIGRATRLLGHLSGHDKDYRATIRLGQATTTDDAEGAPVGGSPAAELADGDIDFEASRLTGRIWQRPSSVSAIKVEGRRAHARMRDGETLELPERPVTVTRFDILARRRNRSHGWMDLDVRVECSAGTYVRALARDLGRALGVGGHLVALRRVRAGPFALGQARTLDELEQDLVVIDMATAAAAAFTPVTVTPADAGAIRHGRPIALRWDAGDEEESPGVVALLDRSGDLLALAERGPGGATAYLAVLAQPG